MVVDGARLKMPEIEGIVLLNAAVAIADVRAAIDTAKQGGGNYTPELESLEEKTLELLGTDDEPGVWSTNKISILQP